jgi:HEAT repeat protein
MSDIILTGIELLAPSLIEGVKNLLNPTDLKKAVNTALSAALKEEENQKNPYDRLFFHSEPHLVSFFLKEFLSCSEVIEELQKPLLTKEMPQVDILVAHFSAMSKKHPKIKPQKKRITPWIKKFIEVYFDHTVSIRYRVAKEKYLEQLAVLYDDIKFSGISVASQESLKSEKLCRIFVVPDVVEEYDFLSSHLDEFQFTSGITDEHSDNVFLQESLNVPTNRRFLATQIFVQARSRKIILLGAPGSGKTLLMSFFAVMLTQEEPDYHLLGLDPSKNWLPILIRIRDWVREPNYSLLEYIKYFSRNVLSINSLAPDFYEYWLEQGQALILLDGLDEVPDLARRYDIAEKISIFLKRFSQNPAIITSRPTGYRPSFFTVDEFCHLSLQPFDPPKIEVFIEKWYDSRFSDPTESSRWQANLKYAISQNDRIKLLAKNPLLLTIITLVHRYEAYLPRHRHSLYNRAVETLLTNWDTGKELNYVWPLEYLKRDSIRRLMELLAYWVHTQGDSSSYEGGTLISREDLLEQLSKFILEEDINLRRHEARNEAIRFLEHIRDRSGLLNEQSPGYYAFVHKTFQEYLTTQEIRDRQEENFDTVTEHISKYLHDAHWREVLLMLVAQQKRSNFEKVLKQILTYVDPYENILNRTLLFSVSCLAEDVTIHNAELVSSILSSLVDLDTSGLPIVTPKIREEIYKVAISLSGTRYASLLLGHYVRKQDSLDRVRLLKYEALLGDRQAATSEIITLIDSQESVVRSKCANALGELEDDSQRTIDSLIMLLRDEDPSVRSSAAEALGNLGNISSTVLNALLLLLEDENVQVQTRVVDALSRLGHTSEEFKQSLVKHLMCEESEVSYRIIEVLCNIGCQSSEVSDYLLDKLRDENKVHSKAAEAIGKLGDSSQRVIDRLLDILIEGNPTARLRAIEALGRLGERPEYVLASLRSFLNYQDVFVRYKAVEALERLGERSQPFVVETLLQLLQDRQLCPVAIVALGRIGVGSQLVKDVLKNYLRRGPDLRAKSAEALGKLDDTSSEVISVLLGNLDDIDPNVRHRTIELLGTLGKTSNQVIEALLEFMGDEYKGNMAATILGRIGNKSEQVLGVLQKKLQDKNPFISCNAAAALIQLGTAKEEVIKTLLEHLGKNIPAVNYRVAAALGQLGKEEHKVSDCISDWIYSNAEQENVGLAVDVLWDLVKESYSSEDKYKVT